MGSVDFIHFFVVFVVCVDVWLLTTSLPHHCNCELLSSTYGDDSIEQYLHAKLCFCSVVVILLECPTSSHADAGDIIASHLPKWKNLRKLKVWGMNPVPILVVVGSCGKLDEVVIINPKHCTVSFPEL